MNASQPQPSHHELDTALSALGSATDLTLGFTGSGREPSFGRTEVPPRGPKPGGPGKFQLPA